MISVLVPVYNRKDELSKLLQSFIDEFLFNKIIFEVIVIDDLSDDGSYEIAKKFSEEFSIFKLITSGYKSPGMSRNIGAKSARFDWLLYCDSDNIMVKNWSVLFKNVLIKFDNFDGIWFPARCNSKLLTSKKYLNKGNHVISSNFYFNNYIGEVVHCIKKDFLINNQYYYLEGTSNDFPDLLWFSLFSNDKYRVFFYNQIIQEYFVTSENRISTDSSIEKNFSQIIHYKLLLLRIIKTKYLFSKHFLKVAIKFIFFILVVNDKEISLKKDVGLFRWVSRISFKIGLSELLLKKLKKKRSFHEGLIR
jgi:glycosyltransferase involved in cell wall biosynthesis